MTKRPECCEDGCDELGIADRILCWSILPEDKNVQECNSYYDEQLSKCGAGKTKPKKGPSVDNNIVGNGGRHTKPPFRE